MPEHVISCARQHTIEEHESLPQLTESSNYKLNTKHFVKFTATKEVQERMGAYCPVPRLTSSGVKYKKKYLGIFPPQAKAGVCMGMILSCFCMVMVCTVVYIPTYIVHWDILLNNTSIHIQRIHSSA